MQRTPGVVGAIVGGGLGSVVGGGVGSVVGAGGEILFMFSDISTITCDNVLMQVWVQMLLQVSSHLVRVAIDIVQEPLRGSV